MSELKKIVMIDDEKAIQILAKMALEKVAGFEVTVFDSGAQALSEIKNVIPDLILLDVIMPEMEGPEVFVELRKIEELNKVPIFFMTGKNGEDEIKLLLATGVNDIVNKPFDPLKLGAQIKEKYDGVIGDL